MTVTSVAASNAKKVVKMTLSLLLLRFNSSKCKTAAKMAVARIKLLRNKREVVVRQMRRDIAMLLKSGQDATARIRVEHVIREQNVLAANEFIELFCELIVARLPIIAKQRECPADLKEGIASLIFASPRCSEIPELVAIRKIFEKKYGKEFVSAAIDLRPNCGVNRVLIDKLSVRTPTGEVKLKLMKEIAKEHQIEWDTTESEKELLKPPEELIEGPNTFVSPASLPINVEPNKPTTRSSNEGETGKKHFQDSASAAEAAAECAKQAIAAAQAAAYLANKNPNQVSQGQASFERQLTSSSINHGYDTQSCNPSNNINREAMNRSNSWESDYKSEMSGYTSSKETRLNQVNTDCTYRRHSYNETRQVHVDDDHRVVRKHSYNNASHLQTLMQFAESDCDEEIEIDENAAGNHPPPDRSPPPVPSFRGNVDQVHQVHQVHPKLPDYDALAARFEALKYRKSLP